MKLHSGAVRTVLHRSSSQSTVRTNTYTGPITSSCVCRRRIKLVTLLMIRGVYTFLQGRVRSVWAVRSLLATSLALATALVGYYTYATLRDADDSRFLRLYDAGVDQLQIALERNYKGRSAAVTAVAAAFAYEPGKWTVFSQLEVRIFFGATVLFSSLLFTSLHSLWCTALVRWREIVKGGVRRPGIASDKTLPDS